MADSCFSKSCGDGNPDDRAEELIDEGAGGGLLATEYFGERFLELARLGGDDFVGVDEALRAGFDEIGGGQSVEDLHGAGVVRVGNEHRVFFLERDFGGGAPVFVVHFA